MKKWLLGLLLVFIVSTSKAQSFSDTSSLRSYINQVIVTNGNKSISAIQMNRILNGLLDLLRVKPDVNLKNYATIYQLDSLASLTSLNDSLSYGGAITVPVIGLQGFNPNTTNISKWIQTVFYPSQPPISNLGIVYDGIEQPSLFFEKMPTGPSLSYTVNWKATRQLSTLNINSIIVDGVVKNFVNPSPGGFVSGSQTILVQRNTNSTYTMTSTTSDNKSSSSSVSVTFGQKRYYGWVSSPSPTDGQIVSSISEFATTKNKDYIQNGIPSDAYIMLAYPSNLGNLSSIQVNGFESIQAFDLITRSVVNSSGFADSYNIYVSHNLINSGSTVKITIQ